MRKTIVALSAVAALTVSLAGCSTVAEDKTRASESSCGSAFDASSPLIDSLKIDGEMGEVPSLTLPVPLSVPTTQRQLLVKGDGPLITSTSQLAQASIFVATSTSGDILGQLGDPAATDPVSVDTWGSVMPGLAEQLLCVPEGSRVAVALSAEDLAPDFLTMYELTDTQGVVAIIDVPKVVRNHADGSDVFNADMGVPSVIRDTNGRPGIVIPANEAPSKIVTQTLLKGDGAPIDETTMLYVHALGVAWDADDTFMNTWSQLTPAKTTLDGFPKQVADELKGATVGSQVMVVLPAGTLTSEELVGTTIPADTALVFVVDILASLS